jgi:hypothetical protein
MFSAVRIFLTAPQLSETFALAERVADAVLSEPDLFTGYCVAENSLPALRTVEAVRDDEGVVRARIVRERWPLTALAVDACPPAGRCTRRWRPMS